MNEIRANKNVGEIAEEADFGEDLGRLTKQGLLDKVKNWLKGIIGKEIVDPLGNKVEFKLNAGETVEEYALHLTAGKDNTGVNDVEERRAKGALLAERTIKKPLVVVTQENGNKMYLALYKNNNKKITDEVIVAVGDTGKGVVVTAFSAEDKNTNGHKNASIQDLSRIVRGAKSIEYFGVSLSGHFRDTDGAEVSQGNAPLRSSVKSNIAYKGVDVKDREQAQRETIRQLKEELYNQKSATKNAALEVVRNCRKYAVKKLEEMPISQSANLGIWEKLAR